jgi:hypothetical protein
MGAGPPAHLLALVLSLDHACRVGAHFCLGASIGSAEPLSHSWKAAVLLILRAQSSTATRREEPHTEHCSSRGKVEELTMPMCPQVQTICSIMCCTKK